jgi:hypothetical protein
MKANFCMVKVATPKGVRDRACCTVLATQFCLGLDFKQAQDIVAARGRKKNQGFWPRNLCPGLGLVHRPDLGAMRLITALESMQTGRFFVFAGHHCFAVVDGRIFDNLFTKPGCVIKAVYEAPMDSPEFLSRYPYLETLARIDKLPDMRAINCR